MSLFDRPPRRAWIGATAACVVDRRGVGTNRRRIPYGIDRRDTVLIAQGIGISSGHFPRDPIVSREQAALQGLEVLAPGDAVVLAFRPQKLEAGPGLAEGHQAQEAGPQ